MTAAAAFLLGVSSLEIVFIGNGDFAGDLLEHMLQASLYPRAVITDMDRPAGRGLHRTPSPVAAFAATKGLTLYKLDGLHEAGLREILSRERPEVVLVADYGHLIPRDVLELCPERFLNVHPSLLPRYRGAAPIRRALLNGEEVSGVSLMVMVERLDAGPLVAQVETPVLPEENAEELRRRLALLGAELVVGTLPRYLAGDLVAEPQDESRATYAAPIEKREQYLDWEQPASSVHNRVRAFAPRPGAWTCWRGGRLKVLRTRQRREYSGLRAGELRRMGGESLVVGTGEGELELLLLQPEGRKRMTAAEFLRGYKPADGEIFSSQSKEKLCARKESGDDGLG